MKEQFLKTDFFINNKVEIILFKSKPFSLTEQLEFRQLPNCQLYWTPTWNIPFFYHRYRKLIVTIHDICPLIKNMGYSRPKRAMAYIYINYALFVASKVITVSQFSKQEIGRLFKKYSYKLNVIYNGSEGIFYNSNNQDDYILFVGSIRPHKNLADLLAAFALLDGSSQTRLVICGKMDNHELLSTLLNEHPKKDKILVTGFVTKEDLKNYYSNCRAVIVPSKYEGFGLPVLEAMQYQKPVICSNIGPLKEVGGNCVLYFTPGNHKELTQQIINVLNGYQPNKLCYQQQLKFFSWQTAAEKHHNILNNLLEQ